MLNLNNLQFTSPTEYLITYPTTITILEYKVNGLVINHFISNNVKKNIT